MKKIAIIGAGGFAREVELLIRDINKVSPQWSFVGFLVSDLCSLRDTDSRDRVIGDFSRLKAHSLDALVFGIGNPQVKLKVAAELQASSPNVDWPTLLHPTAQFDRESANIERGVVMCAGCVGTVNLYFGEFAMINKGCMIGHEAHIGRGAVLNAAANISGGVTMEEGVLVGTGASILQYRTIGKNAVVGSGAVVVKDVEPGATVFGNPARKIFTNLEE